MAGLQSLFYAQPSSCAHLRFFGARTFLSAGLDETPGADKNVDKNVRAPSSRGRMPLRTLIINKKRTTTANSAPAAPPSDGQQVVIPL